MQVLRLAAVACGLAGTLAGCGAKAAGADLPAPYAIRPDRVGGQDPGGAEFAGAVYDRLAAGRGAIPAADGALPTETFQALDADGDGRLTRTEWNRPVDAADAGTYARAYRPFAEATFRQAARGQAALSFGDLDRSLGQHPDRPEGLTVRSFQAATAGGAMDARRFEAFYPSLSGQGVQARGLGQLILGPYLKLAGFAGSEFLLRRPRKHNAARPSQLGYAYEEATLASEDGLGIKAWYIPAAIPSRKAVVMVHGHGSNRSGWVESPIELPALHDAGYNVVAIDLRRHGESGGEWCTMALREDNDVRAGVRWAAARGNAAIGIMGNSLGGASVIHAGARTPEVKAVWDDCAYASVQLAVTSASSMLHLPFIHLAVPAIVETASRRLGEDISGGDPNRWIGRFDGKPVSIVHGAADPYIFAENSRVNYAAARDPKSLWLVPGAGHGNSAATQPKEYQRRLVAFFERYVASAAPNLRVF